MNQTFKWGIIGPGRIARQFAEGLKSVPNAQLEAVASRDLGRAEAFAKSFGAQKAYGKYEDIFQSPLDAIYIATPHSVHYEHTLMCLEKKIPVLCEKPIAINNTEVRRLGEVSRQHKVFLMEGMWTRFLPHIEKLVEIIRKGTIGEVKHIQADFGHTAPFDPESRFFNPHLAGGATLDVGIYPIMLSHVILGKPFRMSSACSIGFTGVDESSTISLAYQSGATASLFSSIIVDTKVEAVVYGTKGHITLLGPWYKPTNLLVQVQGQAPETIEIPFVGNGFNYEIEEVQKCVLAGKQESDKMNHSLTADIMYTMDNVRRQARISYPKEQLVITDND